MDGVAILLVPMVVLTERFLSEVGGWQALKHARSLNAAGKVAEATYSPPMLLGRVREGETEYRAGLEIRSKSQVVNLCRCRESQQWGRICAHSLAVGMAIIKPATVPAEAAPAAPPPVTEHPAGLRFSPDGTQAAEIHLVLPPNFESAWERGRISVALEATCAGRRTLIDALPPVSYRVSTGDQAVIDRLRLMNAGQVTGMASLPKTEFLQLMEAVIGHPRVTLGRTQAVQVTAEVPILRCNGTEEGGLRLVAVLPPHRQILAEGSAVWTWNEGKLTLHSQGVSPAYLGVFSAPVQLDPAAAAHFRKVELEGLRRMFQLEGEAAERADGSENRAPAVPEPGRFLLQLEGSLNHLAAHLFAEYGGIRVPVGAPSRPSNVPRNPDSEAAALNRLHAAGFSGPDREGQLTLRTERTILAFFAGVLPRLERDWKVEIGSRFQRVTAQVDRVTPEIRITGSGQDWFEMGVEFATGGGGKIPAAEIQRLLRSGQSHFRANNGRITVLDADLLDDFEQVLAECAPAQRTPGKYRIARTQAGYLAATLQGCPGFRLTGDALETPSVSPDISMVGDLRETLRHYQWEGVCGMHERAQKLGGAILADEMGLGKTLQALSLIRLQRSLGTSGKPSLVVGPSSLVFNWQREAEKFTPELRVVTVQGGDRSSAWQRMGEVDLVLTSYPILQRDIEQFQTLEFRSVFLDEAQHIKNPETQNARSATALRADFRFVLTGTPVENSIRDVWSLLQFIAPGYLGDRQTFRERFEAPIERDPNAPELSRFRRRISPFLIRRRKSDVLTELPEKTSQVLYYELEAYQRNLYSQLLAQGSEVVAALASTQGASGARMAAFNLLLRLRQVCCDPALVLESAQALLPLERSGKFEAFHELLLEALDGGHRVLVFSQFVKVLGSLREVLDGAGVDFCYLDGSTRDRAREVDRFQNKEGPAVFLISLKAGGTGLNLTAADTVIHVDPWWNPAVEDQATDRVHRIGQSRPVTAYKLIARGTVEEKILALQERKRAIIDAVVESEEPMMSGLTDRDLRELLS